MKINIFQSEIGFYRSATRQIRKETILRKAANVVKALFMRSK